MTPATYAEVLKNFYKYNETQRIDLLNAFRVQTFHLAGNTKISWNEFITKYWPLPGDKVVNVGVTKDELLTREEAQAKFDKIIGLKDGSE